MDLCSQHHCNGQGEGGGAQTTFCQVASAFPGVESPQCTRQPQDCAPTCRDVCYGNTSATQA